MFSLILTLMLAQVPAVRAQTGVVTGQLLRTNGTPASGVRVAVTPVPDPKDPKKTAGDLISLAQSDETGHYRIEDIPPGQYFIQAGFLDLPNYYPGVASIDQATSVTVTAGGVHEVGEFRMAKPAGVSIRGRIPSNLTVRPRTVTIMPGTASSNITRILNTGGSITSPPAGLPTAAGGVFVVGGGTSGGFGPSRIVVFQGGMFPGMGPNPTTINDDGTFEIVGVKPGTYIVLAMPSNPPLMATLVVDDKDIELKMSPPVGGVKVSGFYGLSENTRAKFQQLILTGPVFAQWQATTDSVGGFEFTSVPPGTYAVRNPEGRELTSVVVGDRDVTGLMVAGVVQVSGRVVLDDSVLTVPAFTVTATRKDGTKTVANLVGTLTAYADGTSGIGFGLQLVEGEYQIEVTFIPTSFVVKSLNYGTVDLLKNPIMIDGSSRDVIRLTVGRN